MTLKWFRSHKLYISDNKRLKFLFPKSSATTVELQWLKHIWNHENMFEKGSSS